MSNNKNDWSEYYEFMRDKPPSTLLIEALEHLKQKEKAIDIGGGSLRDARYLLKEGFDVTVIDNSPLLIDEAARIENARSYPIVVSFEDYDFPENEYDIATAVFALNFCDTIRLDIVFEKIKDSLKLGRIFCAELWGSR